MELFETKIDYFNGWNRRQRQLSLSSHKKSLKNKENKV
jgi:hypothetical protein